MGDKASRRAPSESSLSGPASACLPNERMNRRKNAQRQARLVDVEQSHFDRMGISKCGRFRPEPSPTRRTYCRTHRQRTHQGARLDLVALLGVGWSAMGAGKTGATTLMASKRPTGVRVTGYSHHMPMAAKSNMASLSLSGIVKSLCRSCAPSDQRDKII